MSTTIKMNYTRFVAQVSSAPARSKSSYLAMMEENLSALKACPWRVAPDGTPVSLTGHDFTASTQYSDAYDAFKLTGNYDNKAMTEIAYAGMVAYRFGVPASAITGSVPLSSVSLPVSRDRFLRSGLHVAVALSDSATPTSEWSVVRGVAGAAASSVLSQATVANLMAGSAGADVVEIDLSEISSGNPSRYLWVYVTLEDYTDAWMMYNSKEKRLYAVEGSAMLSADSAAFTFDGEVTPDADPDEGVPYLTNPIPVKVTHFEGYHRTLRPRVCFNLLGLAPAYVPHTDESVWPLPVRSILLPVASWTVPEGAYELPLVQSLQTDAMRIPEGDYVLECWIDETGDGKFAPGEPYGCTKQVHLTASANLDRMDIELTEVHPGMPRMDLSAMIAGMPPPSARPEGDPPDPYPVSDSVFDGLAAATDRGRWNLPWATIEPAQYPGTDAPTAASLLTRVRVVRYQINESGANVVSYSNVILDRYFELSVRSILTEADLLVDGVYDLDWGTLLPSYGAISASTLETAKYRIVIGDGDVGENENNGNNLPVIFTNLFEHRLRQTPTVPDPDLADIVYAGRPTFRWSHTNTIDKAYPAFECVISTSNEPSGGSTVDQSKIVWRSGAMRAPARDAGGFYEFTAPVLPGMVVDPDAEDPFTFESGTTYYWGVSMLDAKYTEFNMRSESLTPFSFA